MTDINATPFLDRLERAVSYARALEAWSEPFVHGDPAKGQQSESLDDRLRAIHRAWDGGEAWEIEGVETIDIGADPTQALGLPPDLYDGVVGTLTYAHSRHDQHNEEALPLAWLVLPEARVFKALIPAAIEHRKIQRQAAEVAKQEAWALARRALALARELVEQEQRDMAARRTLVTAGISPEGLAAKVAEQQGPLMDLPEPGHITTITDGCEVIAGGRRR